MSSTVHKCPICNGVGQVPNDFYPQTQTTTSAAPGYQTCRSCCGSGYIVINEVLPSEDNSPKYCCTCGNTDGKVYTSNPPVYFCTVSQSYKHAHLSCESWCSKRCKGDQP